jgi:hypothetical protein
MRVPRAAALALLSTTVLGCKQPVCEPWRELGLPVKKVVKCTSDGLAAQTDAQSSGVEAALLARGYARAFDASKPRSALDRDPRSLYRKGDSVLSVAVTQTDVDVKYAGVAPRDLVTAADVKPALEHAQLVKERLATQAALADAALRTRTPPERCSKQSLDDVDRDAVARRSLVLQDMDHVKATAAGKAYELVYASEAVTGPQASEPLSAWLDARKAWDGRPAPPLALMYKVISHKWQATPPRRVDRFDDEKKWRTQVGAPGSTHLDVYVIDAVGKRVLCKASATSTYTFTERMDPDAKERSDKGAHDRSIEESIAKALAGMNPELAVARR